MRGRAAVQPATISVMDSIADLHRQAHLIEQALDDLDQEERLADADQAEIAREREALLRIADRIEIALQREMVGV